MRRITMAVMTTISGLALLFSYHTSRNEPAATALASAPVDVAGAAADQGTDGTASGSDATATGSGASGTGTDATGSGDGAAAPAPTSAEPSPAPSTPVAARPATTATRTAKATSKTYLGDVVGTHYGPVQVKIVVRSGRIVSCKAVQVPWDNPRDQEINSQAVPMLNRAVVRAQGVGFDGVSGATFTSEGYRQSLQSALDKAHL